MTGRPNARNRIEDGTGHRFSSALTMLRDRETVGLVAQILQEVQCGRGARQDQRELISGDPYLFKPLRQADEGNINPDLIKGTPCGVHLGQAAVNDDQVRPVGKAPGASSGGINRSRLVGDSLLVLALDSRFLGEQAREAALEYLIHGTRVIGGALPVLASTGTHVADFVAREGIGWTPEYSRDSIAKTLRELVATPSLVEEAASRVEALRGEHTWQARARQAAAMLAEVDQRGRG